KRRRLLVQVGRKSEVGTPLSVLDTQNNDRSEQGRCGRQSNWLIDDLNNLTIGITPAWREFGRCLCAL
ncbi:hypothetical protein OFP26_41480, partial [Escherichia coli]|nr:hypothetical protein [Escherichia coli]